ncbi:glycosyltransferase [Synechococcus sp. EJ6-Ellesmere]|nr:glycosyltransferase [Synechococcus sp. EJ6-Ellesmere]
MFNAERFITETLASLRHQSHSHLEIIVVDDGSKDGSTDLVEAWGDPRLTLVRQSNAGQTAALNTALRHCHGNYVQYLDADDLISPNKIALQIARLQGKPQCIASAEWARFSSEPTEARFDPEAVWTDLDPLDWLAGSRAQGGGMLFPALWLLPRQLVEATGPWQEDLCLNNDAEYFTRALLKAERVLFCPGARCYYRSGIRGSLSGHKTIKAWQSQFKVNALCEQAVRQREDSDRIRRGFALSWQILAHSCYPYHPELAEQALERAKALHSAEIFPEGGSAFLLASKVLGWRLARRMQVLSGRP